MLPLQQSQMQWQSPFEQVPRAAMPQMMPIQASQSPISGGPFQGVDAQLREQLMLAHGEIQALRNKLSASETRELSIGERYQKEILMAEMADDIMTGAHASAADQVQMLEAREGDLRTEVEQAMQ